MSLQIAGNVPRPCAGGLFEASPVLTQKCLFKDTQISFTSSARWRKTCVSGCKRPKATFRSRVPRLFIFCPNASLRFFWMSTYDTT